MKAFLIDPAAQTIAEVEYNGDFRSIYGFIGASTFDCARFNREGDAVYIDDEGLINGEPQSFFLISGYPEPLAGKGFVLGCDMDTGDSAPPHVTLDWLQQNVHFCMPVIINGELCFLPIGGIQ